MSFANLDRETGPYFVMAAPSYWAQKGLGPEPPTSVFLHEFAHTRQVQGMGQVLDPIDSTWAYPEELDDDAVQTHFGDDSAYVAAYIAERDLLVSRCRGRLSAEARALAAQALAMIQRAAGPLVHRDKAVFAILDDTFLSMEGAAQWAAYAWLAHPAGGGLDKTKRRRRKWWASADGGRRTRDSHCSSSSTDCSRSGLHSCSARPRWVRSSCSSGRCSRRRPPRVARTRP